MHAVESEMLCSNLLPTKVPYFNAPIYLSNKTQIGKVDEILGPINEVFFTVKMDAGMTAASFKKDDKVYIGGDKLLPIERFLPKPKAAGGKVESASLPRTPFVLDPPSDTSALTYCIPCSLAQSAAVVVVVPVAAVVHPGAGVAFPVGAEVGVALVRRAVAAPLAAVGVRLAGGAALVEEAEAVRRGAGVATKRTSTAGIRSLFFSIGVLLGQGGLRESVGGGGGAGGSAGGSSQSESVRES